MKTDAKVPQTNFGRESKKKFFLWMNLLDALICLVLILVAVIIISLIKLNIFAILGIILSTLVLCFVLTFPFGGLKSYQLLWDYFIHWLLATKKKYSKEEAKRTFNGFVENSKKHVEQNMRVINTAYKKKNKWYSSETVDAFYELITNDISLYDVDQKSLVLDNFKALFQLSNDVDISLIKIDWKYDLNVNSKYLQDNAKVWKNEYKCKDDDVKIQLAIEKIGYLNQIAQSKDIQQKRYFLVVNAKNVDKINKFYDDVKEPLFEAGLILKPCDDKDIDIVIKEFTPLDGKQSIAFKRTHYIITDEKGNKEFRRTCLIKQAPKNIGWFWNADLFNVDQASVNIRLASLEKHKTLFNSDPIANYVNTLNYLAVGSKAKNIIEQAQKEHELESIQDLAEDVANGDEKIKIVKYLVTIKAKSANELETKYRKLMNFVKKNGMRLDGCGNKQWDSCLANNLSFAKILNKNSNMLLASEFLAMGYPYIYSDFMNEKGDLYGYKTNGSNPILIDYCNTDKSHNSWNVACFGKKGGGKTTFIQKIALNFFCNPRFRKIFFIDYENEYTQMTKNFNGDVIDLSGLKKNGGRINPFEIFASSNDEDDNKTHDLWTSHMMFLENFFSSIFKNQLPQDEISLLLSIVKDTYLAKKINQYSDFSKLKHKDFPIFSDLLKELNKKIVSIEKKKVNVRDNNALAVFQKLRNLVIAFTKEGSLYGGIWDAPTNIELKNRIICFDVQELNKTSVPLQIKTAQMLLIYRMVEDAFIENKNHNESLGYSFDDPNAYHVALINDEFHVSINPNAPETVAWVYNWAKRLRKYSGRVIIITQSIQDLTGHSSILTYTTGILNACQYVFVFHLLPNDIDALDKLLASIGGLKKSERNFIQGHTTGECLFMMGNESRIQMRVLYDKNSFENKLLH